MLRRLGRSKFLLVGVLTLALSLAVACGDDATSTPRPTDTPVATPTVTSVPSTPTATALPLAPTATLRPTPTPTNTPVPTPVPTPTPGFMTSEVARLVVTQPPPPREEILLWRQGSSYGQIRHMFETMVGTNAATAQYEPRLATAWEMSADGTKFTVDLQQGVNWHRSEFGEFTAQDVVHSYGIVTSEDSIATDRRNLVAEISGFDIVDDHKLIINMGVPNPELDFRMSTQVGSWSMISKAQWDAEGEEGMRTNPAGTGSWKFNEWALGQHFLYDRVEDHWRQTPEFRELQVTFIPEDATRMAMLLSDEAHIVDLPKDLHDNVLTRGMIRVTAIGSQHPLIYFFGGLYFELPEKFQEGLPVQNVLVREALNRAIDRQEIIDTIYNGQGRPAYFHFNHPTQAGWDASWETRAPELYAYDPDRAREILEEAGMAGFDLTIYNYQLPGTPEMVQVQEYMAQAYQEIGVNVNLETVEFSRVRELYGGRDFTGEIFGFNPGALRPPHIGYSAYYQTTRSFINLYDDPRINTLMDEIEGTLDRDERDRIQREIGEILLTQYTTMPILYVSAQMIINPAVVAEYQFSGMYNQAGDFEYVVAK